MALLVVAQGQVKVVINELYIGLLYSGYLLSAIC